MRTPGSDPPLVSYKLKVSRFSGNSVNDQPSVDRKTDNAAAGSSFVVAITRIRVAHSSGVPPQSV